MLYRQQLNKIIFTAVLAAAVAVQGNAAYAVQDAITSEEAVALDFYVHAKDHAAADTTAETTEESTTAEQNKPQKAGPEIITEAEPEVTVTQKPYTPEHETEAVTTAVHSNTAGHTETGTAETAVQETTDAPAEETAGTGSTAGSYLTDYYNALSRNVAEVIEINGKMLSNVHHAELYVLVIPNETSADVDSFLGLHGIYGTNTTSAVIVCFTDSNNIRLYMSSTLRDKLDDDYLQELQSKYSDYGEDVDMSETLCDMYNELCSHIDTVYRMNNRIALVVALGVFILLIGFAVVGDRKSVTKD